MTRNGGFGCHFEWSLGIEASDHLGHRAAVRIGVSRDARDDPITRSRASEFVLRYETTQAESTINGVDEERTPDRLDRTEKCRDASGENFLHLTGESAITRSLNPNSNTIARGQPRHLRRRQEHTFLLTLDPNESETGAMRRNHAFHGSDTAAAVM
jgi:hypothetical protein